MTATVIYEKSNVSGFDSVFGTSRGISIGNLSDRELLIGGYLTTRERSNLLEDIRREIGEGKYTRLITAVNGPDKDQSYPEDVRALVQDVVRHHATPLFGTLEDMVNTLWSLAVGDRNDKGLHELRHGFFERLILDETHYVTTRLKNGQYAKCVEVGKISGEDLGVRPYKLSALKQVSRLPANNDTCYNVFREMAARSLADNNTIIASRLGIYQEVSEEDWEGFLQHFWQKYVSFHSAKPGAPVQSLDNSWMLRMASSLFGAE